LAEEEMGLRARLARPELITYGTTANSINNAGAGPQAPGSILAQLGPPEQAVFFFRAAPLMLWGPQSGPRRVLKERLPVCLFYGAPQPGRRDLFPPRVPMKPRKPCNHPDRFKVAGKCPSPPGSGPGRGCFSPSRGSLPPAQNPQFGPCPPPPYAEFPTFPPPTWPFKEKEAETGKKSGPGPGKGFEEHFFPAYRTKGGLHRFFRALKSREQAT